MMDGFCFHARSSDSFSFQDGRRYPLHPEKGLRRLGALAEGVQYCSTLTPVRVRALCSKLLWDFEYDNKEALTTVAIAAGVTDSTHQVWVDRHVSDNR